ncbi:MAG: histidinol-phosphate aminotransferase family protein [Acidimicrobiia bacterium]|nr:histidinol-phosphate aminotransferase family protein [Acidimicrobiia bacterium]
MTVQGIPSPGSGLRLHLNENTGGCSPRVIEAIRAMSATDLSAYPDYRRDVPACARHFGVDPDWVVLTNGLDEGILLTALAVFGRVHDPALEAIVPVPAFDPYLTSTAAVAARTIKVPPGPDFAFPADDVLAAITPHTRLIVLNTPNNPTGQTVPRNTIRRVAAAAPHATVLLDEAYVEFADGSFLNELPAHRNVVIGRTFSKAYGLAGMRVGCVIAHPDVREAIRAVTPVFNMNIVAMTAMHAALSDETFLPRYVAQVRESRERLYAACRRLDIRHWPSSANFVLMRVGDRASEIVTALAAEGVHVRDRSRDPHSPGCIRITAGVLEHTDRAVAALEAVVAAGMIAAGGSR